MSFLSKLMSQSLSSEYPKCIKSRLYCFGKGADICLIYVKLKSLETTLAGALRREQMAESSIKQREAEIEQLNRLVYIYISVRT